MYVCTVLKNGKSGMLKPMSDLYLNVPVLVVRGSGPLALLYVSGWKLMYYDADDRLFVKTSQQDTC